MAETVVMVGTRKGLFLLRGDAVRDSWSLDGPLVGADAVYAVGIDTRHPTPRLMASTQSEHWGPSIAWSDDLGASWQESDVAPVAFPSDTGASVARVWQIQPGPAAQPDVVWAGTEPGALFRSDDRGRTFSLVRPLWEHPTRAEWGAGFGGQAVHTVVPHPTDERKVLVAVSTGGVYATEDGGESWAPRNKGIKVVFSPDPYPEFGQCVHKVDRSPLEPDLLFLQNHEGVYRSADAGGSWEAVESGLPANFGFPVVAHPSRPGTAFLFPLEASMFRLPPKGVGQVYVTEDRGESWAPAGEGLPREGFWTSVLRDAFTSDGGDPLTLLLGTRSGEVWAGADEGRRWTQAAAHLPDVLSVRAAVLP